MARPVLTFTSVISLTLCACNPPERDEAAANQIDSLIVDAIDRPVSQAERPSANDQLGTSALENQERKMSKPNPPANSSPAKPPVKPPASAPAEPPRRVIPLSPYQPPAEVDPPHRDPGDKVPL